MPTARPHNARRPLRGIPEAAFTHCQGGWPLDYFAAMRGAFTSSVITTSSRMRLSG